MKRICIIGNSHLACWLAAWRQHKEYYRSIADIRFFMLRGYDITEFVRVNDVLTIQDPDLLQKIVETSDGLDSIRPADYDHILIASLTFGFRDLTPFFLQFGHFSGAYQSPGLTYLSRHCFHDCVDGILERSLAVRLRTLIGEMTDKPVTLSPAPCQSEMLLTTTEKGFAEFCQQGKQRLLYELYRQTADRIATQFNFSIVYQDPATMIDGGGYTKHQHNQNGINSKMIIFRKGDLSHMNIEFGKLELDNALRFLGCAVA